MTTDTADFLWKLRQLRAVRMAVAMDLNDRTTFPGYEQLPTADASRVPDRPWVLLLEIVDASMAKSPGAWYHAITKDLNGREVPVFLSPKGHRFMFSREDGDFKLEPEPAAFRLEDYKEGHTLALLFARQNEQFPDEEGNRVRTVAMRYGLPETGICMQDLECVRVLRANLAGLQQAASHFSKAPVVQAPVRLVHPDSLPRQSGQQLLEQLEALFPPPTPRHYSRGVDSEAAPLKLSMTWEKPVAS